jgi:hypothetical protein
MTKDKSPAFPTLERSGADATDGMLLRDYFAAKAMQSFLTNASPQDGHWHMEAKGAYEVADAMIKARNE